jgi:hypothetical protein
MAAGITLHPYGENSDHKTFSFFFRKLCQDAREFKVVYQVGL